MSHLLKNESTIRQMPERFFIRLERSLEIAQDSVAIDALREPCFPELGLERLRTVRGLFHRGAAVLVQIDAIEIELAARDSEARPCQRELRIKSNRLGIKVRDLFRYVEGLGVVDCDRTQVNLVCRLLLQKNIRNSILLHAGVLVV